MNQLLITHIGLSFDRKRGKFILIADEKEIQQNVCEFLQTISFLVGKDVEEHIMNPDSAFDHVRVPVTAAGLVLTLELKQFISLREAYRHQLFLLKLEDLLMRKGVLPSRLF
jgi:hypothetical protein